MNKKNILLSMTLALAGSYSFANEPELTTQQSDHYGTYLAGDDGRALYLFTKDTQGQGNTQAKSACYDKCAEAWPPLTVDGDVEVGDGLQQDLVSTVERTDGKKQVTYGGWPLYYFARDQGDAVNGQGMGDVWYLVSPDGSKIEKKSKQ